MGVEGDNPPCPTQFIPGDFMQLNKTSPFILHDLYFYDIKSCYYQLSQTINFEMSEVVDINNKQERNIALGKEQIDNPDLQKFFQETTEGIVDYYLYMNGILEDEIVLRQRDGFIITKMLSDNSSIMKLDFREFINFMIISLDRKKYMTISSDGVTIKGMPNQYPGIHKVYDKFKNLNFYNKKVLFKQLKKLKEWFLEEQDLSLFSIDKADKKIIITKKFGLLEIKPGIKIDTNSVDRHKYYELYLKDFIDPIFLYFY